jgi:hypothetical protein
MSVLPQHQNFRGKRPHQDIIEDPHEYLNDDELEVYNHTNNANNNHQIREEEKSQLQDDDDELNELELSRRDVNVDNYLGQDTRPQQKNNNRIIGRGQTRTHQQDPQRRIHHIPHPNETIQVISHIQNPAA